ncbi:MAG: ABC transporter permease [Propionibacteriaceae bacterium]|nr:ABC transporter permease [Propionibacteriaceae bacterium]
MKLHNLGTVIAFEVRRTLAKPTFWIASLSVPILMGLLFALSFFSGITAAQSSNASDAEATTFTYTDASGIVSAGVAERLGGSPTQDAVGAAQAVRDGRADLHIDIPADPAAEGVHVIGRDLGLMDSGRWTTVAQNLLEASAIERLGQPHLTGVLEGFPITSETWSDGAPAPGWASVIGPGLFLVLLFMAIVMLGQQMLNITVEEKENRVTEMVLTTIHPSTLIIGKVLGVVIVGVVQGLVLLVPLLALTLVPGLLPTPAGPDGAPPPGNFVAGLGIDLPRILMGAGLFLGGFLLFTGILVAIGAVMPTAKDAGTAFGTVMIAMFLPLYAMGMVMQAPDSLVSQVMTYFPITAPVTALIRNALGTITLWQAGIVVAILVVSAVLVLRLGIRLFREGSIAYDQRLAWRDILRSSRT